MFLIAQAAKVSIIVVREIILTDVSYNWYLILYALVLMYYDFNNGGCFR